VNRKDDFFTKRIDSHNESNRELICSTAAGDRERPISVKPGAMDKAGEEKNQRGKILIYRYKFAVIG